MIGSFVTANAGKQLAISEKDKIPELANEQERLLIPVIDYDRLENLLDFAVMIKGERNRLPVDLLSVVQDNAEAKVRVKLNQRNLEKAVKHGAETGTAIQVLNRVDLNMTNGVARAVKESLVSDVVLEWDERPNRPTDFFVNTFFGTTTQNIIDTVWETLYVCRFLHPVTTARKILLVLSPNAEYELGFKHWLQKLVLLSKQITARLHVCCTKAGQEAVRSGLKESKSAVEVSFIDFDMDYFQPQSKVIGEDDLVVIVNARKGTLSYDSFVDTIPAKLLRHFPRNNFILLYPEQTEVEFLESGVQTEDLALSPIQEQIDNINKLGKAVKKIFHPGTARPPSSTEE
jgi:hypothetical protein